MKEMDHTVEIDCKITIKEIGPMVGIDCQDTTKMTIKRENYSYVRMILILFDFM